MASWTRGDPDLKQTALRATIRDFVRSEVQERGGTFCSADCDEAVNAGVQVPRRGHREAQGGREMPPFLSQLQGHSAAPGRPEAVGRVRRAELRAGRTHARGGVEEADDHRA